MRLAPEPADQASLRFLALLLLTGSGLLTGSALLLSGCRLPLSERAASQPATQAISGSLHGGQQPVSGAHIYVMQAATSAYNVPSLNIGAPAVSAGSGGGADAHGAFFVSDELGRFSIANAYTCTAGKQIYVLALGGNPGLAAGTSNPALAEMAVLGSCSSLGTFDTTIPFLNLNEVTTVASVYALAGFLSDGTHVSSGPSALAATGLANAFLNANQLANIATGLARDTTPLGTGALPASKIRTLANILAACINSDGTSAACTSLFRNAPSASGALPADTVAALANIAHNPGAHVADLYAISVPGGPFQPALASAPPDFALGFAFSTGGPSPGVPAVDQLGQLWLPDTASKALVVVDSLGNQVASLAPLGAQFGSATYSIAPPMVAIDPFNFGWVNSLSSGLLEQYSPSQGTAIADGGGMQIPDSSAGLAIDASGNLFVTDSTSMLVAVFDHAGSSLSGATGFANGSPWTGIALDHRGRFFVADPSTSRIAGFNPDGTPATFTSGLPATFSTGGLHAPAALAFDRSDNLWAANADSSLSEFNASSGAVLTPSSLRGGGLNFNPSAQPILSLAVDGGGSLWVPNYQGQSLSHFSSAGAALSPSVGFSIAGCSPRGVAVDGSGDVWVTCDSSSAPLMEFIGAAVPVATPLNPATAGTPP